MDLDKLAVQRPEPYARSQGQSCIPCSGCLLLSISLVCANFLAAPSVTTGDTGPIDRTCFLQVWEVLTDYEELPTFVPNLDTTERVPGAPPGRVWLKQRGCSQSLFWRLQAAATLELREVQRPLGRRELRFHMVEGDFQVRIVPVVHAWPMAGMQRLEGVQHAVQYEALKLGCKVRHWL